MSPSLQAFAVPALFTTLGAVLGFFASLGHDRWKSARTKRAFLRAIGMELDELGKQFDRSLPLAQDALNSIRDGNRMPPRFAGRWQNPVFTSQLGKLEGLDDPLLIEVISFYEKLWTLQQILDSADALSSEFAQGRRKREELVEALQTLVEEIQGGQRLLRTLREKLPEA